MEESYLCVNYTTVQNSSPLYNSELNNTEDGVFNISNHSILRYRAGARYMEKLCKLDITT